MGVHRQGRRADCRAQLSGIESQHRLEPAATVRAHPGAPVDRSRGGARRGCERCGRGRGGCPDRVDRHRVHGVRVGQESLIRLQRHARLGAGLATCSAHHRLDSLDRGPFRCLARTGVRRLVSARVPHHRLCGPDHGLVAPLSSRAVGDGVARAAVDDQERAVAPGGELRTVGLDDHRELQGLRRRRRQHERVGEPVRARLHHQVAVRHHVRVGQGRALHTRRGQLGRPRPRQVLAVDIGHLHQRPTAAVRELHPAQRRCRLPGPAGLGQRRVDRRPVPCRDVLCTHGTSEALGGPRSVRIREDLRARRPRRQVLHSLSQLTGRQGRGPTIRPIRDAVSVRVHRLGVPGGTQLRGGPRCVVRLGGRQRDEGRLPCQRGHDDADQHCGTRAHQEVHETVLSLIRRCHRDRQQTKERCTYIVYRLFFAPFVPEISHPAIRSTGVPRLPSHPATYVGRDPSTAAGQDAEIREAAGQRADLRLRRLRACRDSNPKPSDP